MIKKTKFDIHFNSIELRPQIFLRLGKRIMLLAMVQGQIVPAEEAKVSAWDRGYYFGDGIYEVVQAYNGTLWGFDQHFRRFTRSLHAIEIDNVNLDQVKGWIFKAFEAAKIPDCLVYFQITRGCGVRSHAPNKNLTEPQFFLYVKEAPDNRHDVENGITAITYPDIRWKRCDIKSLNLLPNVMATMAAEKRGAEEALFIENDLITEGASSGFFGVIKGKLVTRPIEDMRILPSVTRQAVLAIAERLKIKIEERSIPLKEAFKADELFIASSGHEIRSIIKLEDKPIGSGKPGPIAANITKEFIKDTRGGVSFDEIVKNTRFQLLPTRE
jgi:D-alanine transaminase